MAVSWVKKVSGRRAVRVRTEDTAARGPASRGSSFASTSRVRSTVVDKDVSSSTSSATPTASSSASQSTSPSTPDWTCDFYKASHWLTLERLYRMSGKDHAHHSPLVNAHAHDHPVNLNLLLPECFFVTVNDPPPRSTEKTPDYYANVGDAIRTLREDIPLLFNQDLNYSIYRDDIQFKDPRNSFQGMKNYKLIFWSLRFHGRIFFKRLYVDVKRIWQPEDGIIRMRWTVHGIPRVPWEAEGTFDGISQYKLDHQGRIYEHAVDNVILRDPPLARSPFLAGLNLVPAAPQQQPCPGVFFEDAPLPASPAAARPPSPSPAPTPVNATGSYLARFSWVRFYLALLATVQVLGSATSEAQDCPGTWSPTA